VPEPRRIPTLDGTQNLLDTELTIFFDRFAASLSESAKDSLAYLIEQFKTEEGYIEIRPLISEAGSLETNRLYAAKRAIAVRAFIVALGVSSNKLSIIANTRTEEDQRANRRVDIRVYYPALRNQTPLAVTTSRR
jgi:outer membrane protein OmpA-like peptidoglycan-associated protein